MTNFVVVDATGKLYGMSSNLGNAIELWMVLEEQAGVKLFLHEETLEMAG